MERIIIDMDEVIADPMNEMIEWYRKEYSGDVDWKKMLIGSWVKGFPDEHQGIVMDRLRSPSFFRHLPVMKDSVDVLREMQLPRASLALSLFSFNAGVEIGQIAFVLVVYPLVTRLSSRPGWAPIRPALSIGVTAMAIYWFIQRAFL